MDKKEWLIEVKIKTYNGGEAMKRKTINEAKLFHEWREMKRIYVSMT